MPDSRGTATMTTRSRQVVQYFLIFLSFATSSSLAFLVQHHQGRHLRHDCRGTHINSVRSTAAQGEAALGRCTMILARSRRTGGRRHSCLTVLQAGGRTGEGKKKRGGKKGGRGGGRGGPEGKAPGGEQWGGEKRRSLREQPVTAEFSRKIDATELNRKAKYFAVEANKQECALLSERFSLESISSLKAEFKILRGAEQSSRRIKVKGRVASRVQQLCAASMKPFEVDINEEFSTVIQEVSFDSVDSTLWALEKDSDVDDEIMEGDPLDIGEIASQYLSLAIDPFKRHPDHEGEEFQFNNVSAADIERAFAARAAAQKSNTGGSGSSGGGGGGGGGGGKFAPESEEQDVVLDPEAMRSFFEDD